MTDEEESLPELAISVDADSRAEFLEYSGGPNGNGGTIIFPQGSDVFAGEVNALAIRIADKTGDIEILPALGAKWRQVDKPDGSGALRSIPSKA